MYGYLKIGISDKKMAKLMYAILITKSKLVNCHHLGLEKYTRKQNSGNGVDLVIELKADQVQKFEELAEVKLKTSEEFQGKMVLN
jgi:hypothetical protein